MTMAAAGVKVFFRASLFSFTQNIRTKNLSQSSPCSKWTHSHSSVFSSSRNYSCLKCATYFSANVHSSCDRLFGHQKLHPFSPYNCRRQLSTSWVKHRAPHVPVYEAGSLSSSQPLIDPAKLVEDDLKHLFVDIKHELNSAYPELRQITQYYFDGQGKAIRPLIVALMARAINFHVQGVDGFISENQRKLAMILEMLHTATLVHDDVVDSSDQRRGKPSVNAIWDQKKTIFAGDVMVAVLTGILVKLNNHEVVDCITEITQDLVIGELMQLGCKEREERFNHYITKTFKKTASLLAYGCKAVAILGGADSSVQDLAFQFGRNIGIAFQLVDDLLDFISNSSALGKPAAADLNLGLATAPVLFACDKFPELEEMIMRRFSKPGDVDFAFNAVLKSDGLARTRFLAEEHNQEAIRCLEQLNPSPEQKALFIISNKMLSRSK